MSERYVDVLELTMRCADGRAQKVFAGETAKSDGSNCVTRCSISFLASVSTAISLI